MTTRLRHHMALRLLGTAGLAAGARLRFPWNADDPVLVLVGAYRPSLYTALHLTYLTLLVTTPYLACAVIGSLLSIFATPDRFFDVRITLPPRPTPDAHTGVSLILGEQHHPLEPIPIADPSWLTIPERGLFTGIAIVGAVGTGKTTGCLYPFADQLFGYCRADRERRIGALVLEVKGDFCVWLRRLLHRHGRDEDYVEVSLEGPWRYNPLHNDLDAYALAFGIASLLNNVFGKGKEPFWQQAYTNLIKFIILLHKVVDDYVTLFEVYVCAINPDQLARKIAEGERRCAVHETVLVDIETYHAHAPLAAFPFEMDAGVGRLRAPVSSPLQDCLATHAISHQIDRPDPTDPREADRRAQFEAVKRWFDHDWRRIEPKLRTSIVEGISVFLSLFDDNPAMKRVFCPPKACYDPVANADGHLGRPLPPFAALIEQGVVCALNFPVAANPALAKIIGTLMKQDFQRAVLSRIPAMAREPERHWREVVFLCDEYHAFATVGEDDPTGDEKFFSLSRQAKCIAIVATQSVSSLRSALPGESWRTLLQTFRTKIFLALSDDFSARVASDLCGKDERLTPQYHLAESGQDARISVLTGRAAAHRSTISTSKTYSIHREFVFEAKVFGELKNAQAIVLAYDGLNPKAPTYCYLKPSYLDPTLSYFEQLRRGQL
ncbi:MAG TPA: type IV secretion system DNA-binding domain-containing protein [Vicinamibacterales bacterium]|nr:type IV secretion system DNA-binding domain-containing protein [Vicinamibacterales bacterium]